MRLLPSQMSCTTSHPSTKPPVDGSCNLWRASNASSGFLPPSPDRQPKSFPRDRMRRFTCAPIRSVACFSMTLPVPESGAGVPWLSAAIGTRSRGMPGASRRLPPMESDASGPRTGGGRLSLKSTSFDKLRRLAFGPRVVCVREHQPVGQRGMAIEPKGDERRRIRVREVHFAQHLESVRSNFARVRHEAVNYFQAIDVRLVLLIAAEAIQHG